MKTVHVNLGKRSYDIRIAPGILDDREQLRPWIRGEQVFIITNEVVAPLYLEKITNSLAGKSVEQMVLKDGEGVKTLCTAREIFDRMISVPLERSTTVIALGGGVVGDIAGFVAACYQRGVPFIQIPTTLLSQVDSSVGGKTAVNHPRGKNMIGAFHQPQGVLIDASTLSTLEPRQFSSGIAEVIKYGMINDPPFFAWLEDNIERIMALDQKALGYMIEQSCRNKARIVERDEKEAGMRALLNLGHTFGHAIETSTQYAGWLHGEAVALGMIMAAFMSKLQGDFSEQALTRLQSLLDRARLPTQPCHALSAQKLKGLMRLDKKVRRGKLRLVLLKGIGQAYITHQYDEAALDTTLEYFAQSFPIEK